MLVIDVDASIEGFSMAQMLMLRKCVRHSWDVEYRICERWDECGKIIAMADGWLLASLGCQSQMAY
ncbi:hypothetical protein CEK26_003693 [Fusarium fujikuroi]|uniref:Uncharacterized protein n=1 Tax=Fusarium fujikuroi TaxID=5127 RepID=A0A5Q3GFD3_FUSFU|nr:hypothetical protein CEK27_003685 [Fusarium fujikuroi]QGI88688.1 hypothetical protein CEK25_003644 [Fusarium fujikuroi]QGJ02249.1 hypothetical protein CEK26_003693 [Fusarium fujikuroi]VTT73104.1 unnamed protein product [Fusarium fujikuroi]VTT79703.1 unnamed protein product [Fusarium fujikuroi]